MPKSSRQTRDDIIVMLNENRAMPRRTDLITTEELELVMSKAGVSAPASIRQYQKTLIKLGFLARAGGGYKLTAESQRKEIIRITITPTQNSGEVIRAVSEAIQRFGGVATMEMEADA